MRWFTREWASGLLGDDKWNERRHAYETHLREVRPRLRRGAELLADGIDLHDAQVQSVDYRPHEALRLRVLVGDLQIGYEFVDLEFVDAELLVHGGSTFEELGRAGARTEVLYDEVDLASADRFTHRALLWPAGEYELTFTALTQRRTPAHPDDRRFD